jgi:hypothetical protein
LRKYSKQQAQSGIDVLKLNKGEEKKQKKKKKVDTAQPEEEAEDFGLKQSGKKAVADDEEEAQVIRIVTGLDNEAHPPHAHSDPADEESKLRKLVRSNNFTQQTNALDVDKHM